MNLIQSPVRFLSETHQYFYGELELQGITGMIGRQLFPNKYAAVPEEMLRKAAEKGSNIHTDCQMIDLLGGTPSTQEGVAYMKLKEQWKLTDLENEYLVSDNEFFATCIDKVDQDLNFYDYKTTYALDKDYLSWQLSINKYLFKLQTGLDGGKLFAIWLRGSEATLIPIEEKPLECVIALLEAEKNGVQYNLPQTADDANIATLYDLEQSIIEFKHYIESFEEKKKVVLETLTSKMETAGMKKWETGRMTLTRVDPTTKETVDTKKLKEEKPEIFDLYRKISNVKGSIRITLKEA